jgi:phosphatidylserine decarboxylase
MITCYLLYTIFDLFECILYHNIILEEKKLKRKLYQSFVELTGSPVVSKLIKSFATSKLSKKVIPSFSKTFNINESEMEKNINEFESLHHFFIRSLKKDIRPIDQDESSLVSPVDGVLAQYGKISESNTFLVKGQEYSLDEMIGSNDRAKKYKDGIYFILYLSPRHYHRIHSPVFGTVVHQESYGNKSYPVNEAGLKYGKQPLSRNYRTVTEINTKGKYLSVIKVGALNINTIETTHKNEHLQKGEEIGYFSFGSTVVLLAEKDTCEPLSHLKNEMEVQVGQPIAMIK